MTLNRLKQLRDECSMSQKKLADLLDISQNLVYKWESGQSSPNPETLIKIATLFNVTVDYLIGNSDIRCAMDSAYTNQLQEIISESNGISSEGLEDIRKYMQLVKLKEKTDKRKDAEFSSGHEGSG